ncbi:polysaccharide biosynthesis protein [Ekhidna sp. To15]|uniref:polysaccharide biosynthesis protein n=1 Tax=Ekhidna sp. To15 TaxID=3395267 RepID=UPI003F51AF80
MSVFKGRNIAILGGSGTLGRALVKELAKAEEDIRKVIIYSRDEIKQLEMMDDFPMERFPFLEFMLGDVRDQERLDEVLEGVDYVIHAAALKHVVMAEKNPDECWKTNVLGTENVVKSSKKNGISKVVLISTDKAVSPIGVYGRSKAEAERIFAEANDSFNTYQIVRLGNIIGARGSVFEAFERQKKTGTIKVTHPDATRFFISQTEAAQFILASLTSEDQGPFIPDMKTHKILDLAKEIAPECEIEIIGLRPGDKLHEEIKAGASSETILPL